VVLFAQLLGEQHLGLHVVTGALETLIHVLQDVADFALECAQVPVAHFFLDLD
jgi:hypothetical protein